jgi:hypothetical protein
VILFGLADYQVQEIIEFYASREVAEETLRQVLVDEPAWIAILEIVEIELAETIMHDTTLLVGVEREASGSPSRHVHRRVPRKSGNTAKKRPSNRAFVVQESSKEGERPARAEEIRGGISVIDSPFKMALLRGFVIALITGALTFLTTWGSLDEWNSKTIIIATGTAFLTTFAARGLGEGAVDQRRDSKGDVRSYDVQEAPPPPPAPSTAPETGTP